MSQTVLAEKETNMANSTFSGPVRSEGGFNVINKAASTGVITETGFSVNSTGQLVSMGTRKIQSFAGTLASTNAASRNRKAMSQTTEATAGRQKARYTKREEVFIT